MRIFFLSVRPFDLGSLKNPGAKQTKYLTIENKGLTMHTFFKRNTFISNAKLQLAKNQAKDKQHREAELLLCKNY